MVEQARLIVNFQEEAVLLFWKARTPSAFKNISGASWPYRLLKWTSNSWKPPVVYPGRHLKDLMLEIQGLG